MGSLVAGIAVHKANSCSTRFYKVGGDTRVAGFMLAAATTVLLVVGTGPIAYIRMLLEFVRFNLVADCICSGDGCWCADLRARA